MTIQEEKLGKWACFLPNLHFCYTSLKNCCDLTTHQLPMLYGVANSTLWGGLFRNRVVLIREPAGHLAFSKQLVYHASPLHFFHEQIIERDVHVFMLLLAVNTLFPSADNRNYSTFDANSSYLLS